MIVGGLFGAFVWGMLISLFVIFMVAHITTESINETLVAGILIGGAVLFIVGSQIPCYARVQDDARELEQKRQRAEEIARRKAFEKRAEEIGYANALIESAKKVDTAMTEAKTALRNAIVYKK